MWLLVAFMDSGKVGIVPNNWLCPGEKDAWWPDTKLKHISSMVFNKQDISKGSWERLPVKILYKSNDYLKVERKMRKTQFTQIAEEKKKRIQRKRLWSDSSSGSEDLSLTIGKATKLALKSCNEKPYAGSDADLEISGCPRLSTLPSLLTSPNMKKNRGSDYQPFTQNEAPSVSKGNDSDDANSTDFQRVAHYSAAVSSRRSDISTFDLECQSVAEYATPSRETDTSTLNYKESGPGTQCTEPASSKNIDTNHANSTDSYSLAAEQSCSAKTSDSADPVIRVLLQKILEKTETVFETMRNLEREVRSLRSSASHNDSYPVVYIKDELELPDGVSLPLQNQGDLDNLEDVIKSSAEEAKLIYYLSLLGGITLKKAGYNALNEIFSPLMALRFSWTGIGKNKMPFQTLKLCGTVLKALRRNPALNDVTFDKYRSVVQEFFRTSSDRDGGRKRRELRKLKSSGCILDAQSN